MTTTPVASPLRFAILIFIAAACIPPGRAQTSTHFTGDLFLTGDSTYVYREGQGGGEFGAWTLDAGLTGEGTEEGALWTNNLPNSIDLQANAVTTATGTDTLLFTTVLSMAPDVAGTLNFTVDVTQEGNATGGFYYTNWPTIGDPVNSSTYTAGTYTFSIDLEVNGGFAFNVFANDLTAGTGDHDFTSATISNISFTPAGAVPEPSSCAALAGACALGFVALRRRYRAKSAQA